MSRGHKEVVVELLNRKADPTGCFANLSHRIAMANSKNNFNKTPLHYASEEGHKEVVVELLNREADPDPKNNFNSTPLHDASEEGHKEVVVELLNCEVDPGYHVNNDNKHILHHHDLQCYLYKQWNRR